MKIIKVQNKEISISTRHSLLIPLFYRSLLQGVMSFDIEQSAIDENLQLDDTSRLIIKTYETDYQTIIDDKISPLLASGWKWERLPIIIQALLLIGYIELNKTDLIKEVVILELVNYSIIYATYFDFEFVNAILDKMK